MLSSMVHDLVDIFLPQLGTSHHFSHQLLDYRLPVDAVHQEVVKLVSYFFQLSRALFFYYELPDLPYLLLVWG